MTLRKLLLYAEIGMKTNMERNEEMLKDAKNSDTSISYMNQINDKISKDLKVLREMNELIEEKQSNENVIALLDVE